MKHSILYTVPRFILIGPPLIARTSCKVAPSLILKKGITFDIIIAHGMYLNLTYLAAMDPDLLLQLTRPHCFHRQCTGYKLTPCTLQFARRF